MVEMIMLWLVFALLVYQVFQVRKAAQLYRARKEELEEDVEDVVAEYNDAAELYQLGSRQVATFERDMEQKRYALALLIERHEQLVKDWDYELATWRKNRALFEKTQPLPTHAAPKKKVRGNKA